MSDGKRNRIAEKEVQEDAGAIAFKFTDGETVVANLGDIPAEQQKRLCLHGFSQKLGDSYSGAETPAEARERLTKTLEALAAGNWSTRSEGGGGPRVTLLAEAISRATGNKDINAIVVKLQGMEDDVRKALPKHRDIAPFYEQIKAERAAERAAKAQEAAAKADPDEAGVDLASLFAG